MSAAILSVGCQLPGHSEAQSLWSSSEPARTSSATSAQWDPGLHGDLLGLREPPQTAGLDRIPLDWKALRIPPFQAERMHKMERAGIAAAASALRSLGPLPSEVRNRARVIISAPTLGPDPLTDHGPRVRRFQHHQAISQAMASRLPPKTYRELDEIVCGLFHLAAPPIEPDSLMTSASIVGGRLANIFDLRGGHLAVDTGATSSMAAMCEGHDFIARGDADLVIVCGLTPIISPSLVLSVHARLGRPDTLPVLWEGALAMVLGSPELARGRALLGWLAEPRSRSGAPRTQTTRETVAHLENMGGLTDLILGLPRLSEEPMVDIEDIDERGDGYAIGLRRHPVEQREPAPHVDLAIVGMGVYAPGSHNIPAFRRVVERGGSEVDRLPSSRFDVEAMVGADPKLASLLATRLAATVDTEGHEGSYDAAGSILLRACEEAMDGQDPHKTTAFVLGQLPLRAGEQNLESALVFRNHLDLARESMLEFGIEPELTDEICSEAHHQFGEEHDVSFTDVDRLRTSCGYAQTVSDGLDLHGPVLCVDAACASSLAALELAAAQLRDGRCHQALAAGVAFNLLPEYYISLSVLGALSRDGATPLSADSDGFVPAEGAGAVVLKRLDDAVRDGDPILAVVRGLGTSSDGNDNSVFAPSRDGQRRAMERALDQARLDPASIDYVELHGTGTTLGDQVELQSVAEVYGDREPMRPLSVGSVKAQVGHASSASGMLGLIRSVLSLQSARLHPHWTHRVQPAVACPGLELGQSLRTWTTPQGVPRRAAVSAVGLGGVNYHVILEQAVPGGSPDSIALAPPAGLTASCHRLSMAPLQLSAQPRLPVRGTALGVLGSQTELRDAVCRELAVRGAEVTAADSLEPLSEVDGIIDLSTADNSPIEDVAGRVAETIAGLRPLYGRWESSRKPVHGYVAVGALGGDLGLLNGAPRGCATLGLFGLAKALRQELPQTKGKAIDVDPDAPPQRVAGQIVDELEDGNDCLEVGLADGRSVLTMQTDDDAVFDNSMTPVRPASNFRVALFTGGGRGVAFECAMALASGGTTVVVTGRTPVGSGDEPWLRMDDDAFAAFRMAELIRRRASDPSLTPVRFAEEFSLIERKRELHGTLARARKRGLPLHYMTCDVTDAASVSRTVQDVTERFGSPDLVVHAAMVEWSCSLPAKREGRIRKTIDVKLGALENLIDAFARRPPKSLVCFSSGAGRFGNRGQTDYAAANALMVGRLARLPDEWTATHCASIDWTAWSGTGAAVADPDLEQRVRETGVTSVGIDEGVFWFLHQLEHGQAGEVVVMGESMSDHWQTLRADRFVTRTTDDIGLPLHRRSFPLIDHVEHTDPGAIISRRLSLHTDPFLHDHALHGAAILPATFGCELIAEAALVASPGWHVVRVEDFHVQNPAKLHRGRPLDIRGRVERVSEDSGERVMQVVTSTDLYLRDALLEPDRALHDGAVRLRRNPRAQSRLEVPTLRGPVLPRSVFVTTDDPITLGRRFRRAAEIRVDETRVTGRILPPDRRDIFAHTRAPRFVLQPLVLDTAFQIAANWDGVRNGFVSVPLGVESIDAWTVGSSEEPLFALGTIVRVEGDDCIYNVDVVQGDGVLLLSAKGLILRRVASLPRPRRVSA